MTIDQRNSTMSSPATPRLTVLGTGYLGATHAICMAVLGYDVLGVDTDRAKVAALNEGRVPFFEPGLPELLRKALDSGRLSFTTDLSAAGDFGDVHFICVGTPQQADSHAADLRYVEGVARDLAPYLRRRCLVVGKSTVPVGTAARLTRIVQDNAPAGAEVELAWNPEFLREGYAVEDTLRPDRLVFGVASTWAEETLRATFAPVIDAGVPVVTTDLPTAELVKVAANSFLATKISYINAMAEVCEASGGDVTQLARAIGYDPRIGNRFLQAGVGFGGGCLPKDIRAFQARAQELGAGEALRFLHEVDLINLRRRNRVLQLAAELLDRRYGPAGPDLSGTRIAVLGATFKPNSDDVRDAPSLAVAAQLAKAGADVRVYDPQGMENARRAQPDLTYSPDMIEAVRDADLVCVLTEWSDFRNADPEALARVVAGRRVVDGRNCLDSTLWVQAGWEYRGMGRP